MILFYIFQTFLIHCYSHSRIFLCFKRPSFNLSSYPSLALLYFNHLSTSSLILFGEGKITKDMPFH